MRAKNLCLY